MNMKCPECQSDLIEHYETDACCEGLVGVNKCNACGCEFLIL